MPERRRRLDRELVDRGLAADVEQAHALIGQRRVLVDGAPALSASRLVAGSSSLRVEDAARRFVSRGGTKLEGALEDLGISVTGRRCLDAGAGVGGFTDCLLQRGARSVVAVDVGYGDFDWRLRGDPRVRLLERVNVRTLDAAELGEPFDLIVADLSFISLVAVLDVLVGSAGPGADLLLLVKPQFEAPRGDVGPGGIVDDPRVWEAALSRVGSGLSDRGFATVATVPSRLKGAEGNQEFFLLARREGLR
jgi:23S rRNA (cytidine1920-2'-O)/16S rRNA (cytidine1409-2'-O)-methyltransferase